MRQLVMLTLIGIGMILTFGSAFGRNTGLNSADGALGNNYLTNAGVDDEYTYPSDYDDENGLISNGGEKRSSHIYVYRRGCIRRGGACDHRPNECCFSSSCRCNLWGSNCRCQRMGLFQKWG